jgi:hypothetical protein
MVRDCIAFAHLELTRKVCTYCGREHPDDATVCSIDGHADAGILNSGRLQRGGRYPGQELIGLAVLFLLAADLAALGLGIAALC